MSRCLETYLRGLAEAPAGDGEDEDGRPLGANPFAPRPIGRVKDVDPGIGTVRVASRNKDAPPGPVTPQTAPLHATDYVPPPESKGQPQKPGYRGHYVGQTVTLGRQRVDKNTAWKDASGQQRFGKTKGWGGGNDWVWDGRDWVKPGAFDHKFKGGKKMGESTRDALIELCLAETHDESEDIEDLETAGDAIEAIDRILDTLRHLVDDVEDHEREEEDGDDDALVSAFEADYFEGKRKKGKKKGDRVHGVTGMGFYGADGDGSGSCAESVGRMYEADFPWDKFDDPDKGKKPKGKADAWSSRSAPVKSPGQTKPGSLPTKGSRMVVQRGGQRFEFDDYDDAAAHIANELDIDYLYERILDDLMDKGEFEDWKVIVHPTDDPDDRP